MSRTKTKPAPRRRTPEEKAEQLHAVACHALGKFAGKHADRELLEEGAKHQVALNVAGHIDGRWVTMDVNGELQVGHDQTAATSTACDLPHLVAVLLEAMPKTRRRQLLAEVPEIFLESKALPPVEEETRSAAATLLDKLRQVKTITKKGNVRFEPRPAAEPPAF